MWIVKWVGKSTGTPYQLPKPPTKRKEENNAQFVTLLTPQGSEKEKNKEQACKLSNRFPLTLAVTPCARNCPRTTQRSHKKPTLHPLCRAPDPASSTLASTLGAALVSSFFLPFSAA